MTKMNLIAVVDICAAEHAPDNLCEAKISEVAYVINNRQLLCPRQLHESIAPLSLVRFFCLDIEFRPINFPILLNRSSTVVKFRPSGRNDKSLAKLASPVRPRRSQLVFISRRASFHDDHSIFKS